jgi:GT2 family glycosyltransferase
MGSSVSAKRIVILIPVHNGLELTRKCLENLYEILASSPDDRTEFFVLVVDDGSTDSTSQWIKSNYKDCIVLQGDGNLWWSGAINMGAKYALDTLKADYLLLWNNDIQIPPDYFTVLSDIILKRNAGSIMGSVIFSDPDYRTVWSAGGVFNPITGSKYMHRTIPENNAPDPHMIEVDWLTGMGTLVPRQAIEKIGYWDARRFPQYYGDCDFTYRAKLNGFKITVHTHLKIVNDLTNSGIKRINRFSEVIAALTSIKSINHIGKNFMFYRLYARSPRAYLKFLEIYFYLFGGFFKRKITGLFHAGKLTNSTR